MCVRVCVCVCVCVCVYPGYVQSPGWDGRTLIYIQNLVGKNVTVKVPPQHKVMLSFKDVHMRGMATNWCHCLSSGVRVLPSGSVWARNAIEVCEFILLTPVLRDFNDIDVVVFKQGYVSEDCRISETGYNVHVSCLIMFHLTVIGNDVLRRWT